MPNPQSSLNLPTELNSVEEYTFEPIKGYPMLHWKGKRPFNATQFYPAQLKEVHGQPTDGWLNKIFWGDNLQVMSHLLKEYRGQVDLVYIDPPFDSKADYKKKVKLRGRQVTNDQSAFEEKQYTDIWTNDDYLQFMYERFIMLRELLSESGTIYLHCDYRRSHYLKLIMDEVLGSDQFINEIIWLRTNAHNMKAKGFARSNDNILFYTKSEDFTFNEQYTPYGKAQLKRYKEDEHGNLYTGRDLTFSSTNSSRQFEWRGTKPPANRSWGYSKEDLEELWKKGLILLKKDGTPRLDGLKVYLSDQKGTPLNTNWNDIQRVSNTGGERTDYPTQKPEALLQRIIKSSTNPGDLVFDCFMGSGTTQAVAMKLGRRFIGADINLGAIQTTTKRLIGVATEIAEQQAKAKGELPLDSTEKGTEQIDQFYTGFEVYNVNHYDVFRNPVEARDILLQALEIQPLPGHTIYDGEKDGRMVKLMPVNRIATRADLNPLITGFNYKVFEQRNQASPGKPVESLLLVCMGHEPDLAATLQKEVPYKLDIEVVDILRDRSQLEFKRDSEAEVVIEDGELIIRQFYPMNLLQKLSLLKENVADWRELTESIMIDWNYDGAVLEPAVVDVPAKDELVAGRYSVPDGAGTVRVKITDVLAESLEVEVQA